MTASPWLVLVTDPGYSLAWVAVAVREIGRALGQGRLLVQHRDKQQARDVRLRDARLLRTVTRDAGALLVVNGDVEIAREVDADGAHVPGGGSIARARRELGPDAFVSAAAHTDEDVRRALREDASAVLVSPIFPSPAKGGGRGVEALSAARRIAGSSMLVYALGGVDASRAASCWAAGADGVAVIRAILAPQDEAETGAFFAARARALVRAR